MYTLSQLFIRFCILYDYLYIFVMNIWFEHGEFNWSMPHQSQVLWLSHFTVDLDLSYNKLTGTLPTEIGRMNQLSKLLCTHCLNSLLEFVFCMIICISLLWIYYLNIESLTDQCLTIPKSCDFLISQGDLICQITNWRAHFPLKLGICISVVSYCVHILSTL